MRNHFEGGWLAADAPASLCLARIDTTDDERKTIEWRMPASDEQRAIICGENICVSVVISNS